jgi:hypothetical protein
MSLDSGAYRDADFAHVEVPRWINEVAGLRGWSSDALGAALAAEQRAYTAADEVSFIGADLRTYWAALAAEVTSDPAYLALPGGAAFVGTITGAVQTVDAEAEYASRQGLGGILGGLGAATRDVGTAAADAGKRTVGNPVWVWGVAAIVIGVAVIQSGVLRRR